MFVQANFGARRELVLAGVPLGDALADDDPMLDWVSPRRAPVRSSPSWRPTRRCSRTSARRWPGGSPLGLARTGTSGSHFSGDLFLAFSTANPGAFRPGLEVAAATESEVDRLEFIPWKWMAVSFAGVVQATEEANGNALVANHEMTGREGHRSPALPRDQVAKLLASINGARLRLFTLIHRTGGRSGT